jgi:hypothetical protein
MDSGRYLIYGGWDLNESDPSICWRLAILIVLVKSTLDRIDDATAD